MDGSDRIVSLKDWIDSFWDFQEEDLKYFQDLMNKKIPFNPEDILKNIKDRMQTRRAFYQIYKHLPKKELPIHELEWAEKKLAEIVYREELITSMVNKILEILTLLIEPGAEISTFEHNFILH